MPMRMRVSECECVFRAQLQFGLGKVGEKRGKKGEMEGSAENRKEGVLKEAGTKTGQREV